MCPHIAVLCHFGSCLLMTQLQPEASPVCSRTRRWACHGSSGLYYLQALISPAGLGTEGWEDGEGVRVQTPVQRKEVASCLGSNSRQPWNKGCQAAALVFVFIPRTCSSETAKVTGKTKGMLQRGKVEEARWW